MGLRKVVVFRVSTNGGIHDRARAGDTLVDGEDNEIFVLGVTPKLSLPEYDNLTPQEGDIWKWNNKLWTHLNGITQEIVSAVVPPSSSASATVSSSLSSSSTSAVLSSSSLSSLSSSSVAP